MKSGKIKPLKPLIHKGFKMRQFEGAYSLTCYPDFTFTFSTEKLIKIIEIISIRAKKEQLPRPTKAEATARETHHKKRRSYIL